MSKMQRDVVKDVGEAMRMRRVERMTKAGKQAVSVVSSSGRGKHDRNKVCSS